MFGVDPRRFIIAGLALLAVASMPPGRAIAKPSRVYLNIPKLIDEDVAQVEKITGHPTRIDKSNDDVGWTLREYSLPFGKVKIDYLDSKAASFTIVVKSPEHSAVALARRFGINVVRRKPEDQKRLSKTWSGGFASSPIREVNVDASHDAKWDTIGVIDYESMNE